MESQSPSVRVSASWWDREHPGQWPQVTDGQLCQDFLSILSRWKNTRISKASPGEYSWNAKGNFSNIEKNVDSAYEWRVTTRDGWRVAFRRGQSSLCASHPHQRHVACPHPGITLEWVTLSYFFWLKRKTFSQLYALKNKQPKNCTRAANDPERQWLTDGWNCGQDTFTNMRKWRQTLPSQILRHQVRSMEEEGYGGESCASHNGRRHCAHFPGQKAQNCLIIVVPFPLFSQGISARTHCSLIY